MDWSDEVDTIIDGDLTAGLAYVTPAGGGNHPSERLTAGEA